MTDEDPFENYNVVVNHEEQYSIWPEEKEIPKGWKAIWGPNSKKECLDHIEVVWTDMRPLSLRKKMEEWERNPPKMEPVEDPWADLPPLVKRLAEKQKVTVGLRPEKTAEAFEKRLAMGFVHIFFTETHGGTELGVQIDKDESDWSQCDFKNKTGIVHIEGHLTLDFVPVRCIADIGLASLEGHGCLEEVVVT